MLAPAAVGEELGDPEWMWGPSDEEITSISLGLGSWEWTVTLANEFPKPEFTNQMDRRCPVERWNTEG